MTGATGHPDTPVYAARPAGPAGPAGAAGAHRAALAEQAALRLSLEEDPHAFEFFQAVRVLERLLPHRAPVGGFGDPADEVAHFGVPATTAFPASDIQALEIPTDAPARVTVNFMGLTGPSGLLPYTYTHLVAERLRAKDPVLRDFLDLFHHRLTSLFYRAWEKYRFTVAYERGADDRLTPHLLDLLGLGTAGLRGRLPMRDETMIFYAGLLGLGSRPAVALEQMLEDYFRVPVEVEQFVGGWYALDAGAQCRVGEELDASAQLGVGAVAGDEVWDQQARVRIRLGPLTRRQYDDFLPTGGAHEALQALARFFGGEQFDYEIQLVLARDEVPGCTLGADEAAAAPLGWCTWLRSAPFTRDPDDTILTP